MPAGRYYVDTSAYLCLLLGEAGWQRLAGELGGAQLLSSALLALEAERTLVHLSRAGQLTSAELQDALDRRSAISITSPCGTSRSTSAVGGSCRSCRRRARSISSTYARPSGSTSDKR